jgi:hypothetical protein
MKWGLFFLMAVQFVVTTARGEDRALLIGVGEYAHDGLNRPGLPGIAVDLQRMQEFAVALGFDSRQIRILRDREATAARVEKEIRGWLGQAGPDDRVFFYFSGHGSMIPDQSGDEVDGVDEALCLYDMQPAEKNGAATLTGVLADDDFDRLLNELVSRQVFIVLDNCHSGTATKGLPLESGGSRYVSKFFSYKGMPNARRRTAPQNHSVRRSFLVVLSACRDDEESVTSAEGSLFTEAIFRAQQGHLASTLTDTSYLRRYAEDFVRVTLGGEEPRRIFHPQLQGNMVLTSRQTKAPVEQAAPMEPGWLGLLRLADAARGRHLSLLASQEIYRIGEPLTLELRLDQAGYLYCFGVDSNDAVTMIYPNSTVGLQRFDPGMHRMPDTTWGFSLRAAEPRGENLLLALLAEHPLSQGLLPVTHGAPPGTSELASLVQAVQTAPEHFSAAFVRVEVR